MRRSFSLGVLILTLFITGCGETTQEVVIDTTPEKTIDLSRTYDDISQGFRLEYPGEWRAYKDKNNVAKILTLDSVNKPLALEEQKAEIEIRVKENADRLAVEGFYDGINDINLFVDANNGSEPITVAGRPGLKFFNVVGVVPSDVVVIPVDDNLYEFTLNDQRYQAIFNTVLDSVTFP